MTYIIFARIFIHKVNLNPFSSTFLSAEYQQKIPYHSHVRMRTFVTQCKSMQTNTHMNACLSENMFTYILYPSVFYIYIVAQTLTYGTQCVSTLMDPRRWSHHLRVLITQFEHSNPKNVRYIMWVPGNFCQHLTKIEKMTPEMFGTCSGVHT